VRETFTVRKVSFGVGVERTFPVHTPVIDKIEVVTRGDVRRAKLYYLRELRGKAAKIKERRDTPCRPLTARPDELRNRTTGRPPPGGGAPPSPAALALRRRRRAGAARPRRVLATSMVRTFLVAPFSIPSGSMEQTLHVGDRILVDRLSYRLHDVRRGDIVVFDGTEAFGRLGTAGRDRLREAGHRAPRRPRESSATSHGDGVSVNGTPLDESAYLLSRRRPSELRFAVDGPGRAPVADGRPPVRLAGLARATWRPGGGIVPIDKVLGG
jgi:hypothetical protein